MRLPFLFLLLVGTFRLAAQDLTAFLDFRERLIVFDKGSFVEVEGMRPQHFDVGGNYVAYANAIGDLKMYRDGRTVRLDRSANAETVITDHLLGFRLATVLKVDDGRQLHTLCANTNGYIVEDSVAAWYDDVQRVFRAWYRGRTYPLEDALANEVVQSWKSGDNLIAWVTNIERLFKVFYRGEVIVIDDVFGQMDFKAGADVVVYIDPRGNGLKAFHRGDFYDLDPIAPQNYQVGKGIAAWVDRTGAMKVLQNGMVYTATDFAPAEYHVRDSLVIFRDQGMLKVFQDGNVYEVERYWPDQWDASWGMMAYRAVDGTLRVWRRGQGQVALREMTAQNFSLQRGVLLVQMPLNAVRVWWRGEIFTN